MSRYPTLTPAHRAVLEQRYTASVTTAKAAAGAAEGGCGFCAAQAILLPQTDVVAAYEAAVDILHVGLRADISNSRRVRRHGHHLLALRTALPLLSKRNKQFELWFDISAIVPKPEEAIEDADLFADELAQVVYNSSLGHLLYLLDENSEREMARHPRYNLYSSDGNEIGLMYAAMDCADAELLDIMLTRTSLSLDTVDEECASLARFYYRYQNEEMIAVLKRHGLGDYDPATDPYYSYYVGEDEEDEDEEENEDENEGSETAENESHQEGEDADGKEDANA